MLPAVSTQHVARPVAVLVSNVPGDYAPDQWADIVTDKIISVSDNANDERKQKTAVFRMVTREILINVFRCCQEQEQYALSEYGCDRYGHDLGIDGLVNEGAHRIIAAARERLVFGSVNLGDLYYARHLSALCNVIGTNLATSVMITRRWHAHEREDDPRARKFLALH